MPHAQRPQWAYLRALYDAEPRLTFDREGAETLGVYETPAVTALVLVKEHSERLPGKNVRAMCGYPLFYWMLRALHQARRVSEVVVDTDSTVIAAAVREHFPRTRIVMNTPRANANEVIASDLPGMGGDHFLQAHPTSPLLRAETVDAAVAAYFAGLAAGDCDSMFSVTPHQSWFFTADASPLNSDTRTLMRSQDMPPIFESNSAFHIFSRASFARTGSRVGGAVAMYPISKSEAVDIDTAEDFAIAEAIMQYRIGAPEGIPAGRERGGHYMDAVVYSTKRNPDGTYLIRGAVARPAGGRAVSRRPNAPHGDRRATPGRAGRCASSDE
jgi:N-acylneuraminate cytidylyltransferase